ncbi:hypothetical protein B0H16DRAFT_1815769 [Mycena metata]|uniref:Uncharacterized protein n=1 Tax=Mycena metata TaxID=1033252 RepID=A0AAD7H596_9AGAR|nr:hypothetical protein B0H16DRAFT_1815769 [Mycena metata]
MTSLMPEVGNQVQDARGPRTLGLIDLILAKGAVGSGACTDMSGVQHRQSLMSAMHFEKEGDRMLVSFPEPANKIARYDSVRGDVQTPTISRLRADAGVFLARGGNDPGPSSIEASYRPGAHGEGQHLHDPIQRLCGQGVQADIYFGTPAGRVSVKWNVDVPDQVVNNGIQEGDVDGELSTPAIHGVELDDEGVWAMCTANVPLAGKRYTDTSPCDRVTGAAKYLPTKRAWRGV